MHVVLRFPCFRPHELPLVFRSCQRALQPNARATVSIFAAALLAHAGTAQGQLLISSYDVARNGSGRVSTYTLDGAQINPALITGFQQPRSVIVAAGYLFVTDSAAGTIGQYTLSCDVVNAALVTGLNRPYGIVESGGQLFVVNNGSGTVGEYTLTGQTVNTALITGLTSPTGITESGGNLFVTNYTAGTVSEFTTAGNPVNLSFITGLNNPIDIKAIGGFFYITNHADGAQLAGSISRYTMSPVPIGGRIITRLTGPESIAIDGNHLYVTIFDYNFGASQGHVEEYDLRNGQMLSPNLVGIIPGPLGIAIVPEPATCTFLFLTIGITASLIRGRKSRV